MRVNILLFATLKDLAGEARFSLDLPESATIADARRILGERHPRMAKNLETAIAALNREFAFPEELINEGDEVAFFPPVSGGSGYAEIARLEASPFSTDALINDITTSDTGAVCVFSGMVRGETRLTGDVERTDWLEYEAYEAMALEKMRQVIHEIREQYPLVQGIAVVQRVGRLEVGQNTIVIACASAHRDQGCFEAARYGIDRLKEIVPVWKREVRADGSSWVEGGYHPNRDDKSG
jgi:molybdopterin synthase catalytic subunit